MSLLLDYLGAVAALGVVVLLLLALGWAWRMLWGNPLTLWRRMRMRWTTARAKRKVRRTYVKDAPPTKGAPVRIRQEMVERHIVEGDNEEKHAVLFQRYTTGEWRLRAIGPKPTDSPGRFSPTEFRAVFERVTEEKEVAP